MQRIAKAVVMSAFIAAALFAQADEFTPAIPLGMNGNVPLGGKTQIAVNIGGGLHFADDGTIFLAAQPYNEAAGWGFIENRPGQRYNGFHRLAYGHTMIHPQDMNQAQYKLDLPNGDYKVVVFYFEEWTQGLDNPDRWGRLDIITDAGTEEFFYRPAELVMPHLVMLESDSYSFEITGGEGVTLDFQGIGQAGAFKIFQNDAYGTGLLAQVRLGPPRPDADGKLRFDFNYYRNATKDFHFNPLPGWIPAGRNGIYNSLRGYGFDVINSPRGHNPTSPGTTTADDYPSRVGIKGQNMTFTIDLPGFTQLQEVKLYSGRPDSAFNYTAYVNGERAQTNESALLHTVTWENVSIPNGRLQIRVDTNGAWSRPFNGIELTIDSASAVTAVSSFVVLDNDRVLNADAGGTSTDSSIVTCLIESAAAAGAVIDGYHVNETGVAPLATDETAWDSTNTFPLTFSASPSPQPVILYAFVRDDQGSVSEAKAASFIFGELDKSIMSATASVTSGASVADRILNGDTNAGWYGGTGSGYQWLRIDMGLRHEVHALRFRAHNDIRNTRIYVTDSTSDNFLHWGPILASSDSSDEWQDFTIQPSAGRYLILRVNYSWHRTMREVWLYGMPAAQYVEPVELLTLTDTTASVTWETDSETAGQVKYREVGATEWTYTAEQPATQHSHLLTGLDIAGLYEVVIINDGIEDSVRYYSHMEIPKAVMTPTASHVASTGPNHLVTNVINDDVTVGWYAGTSRLTTWLRIDLGKRHELRHAAVFNSYNIHWMNIHVTDSTSNDPANWGSPAGSTTASITDAREEIPLTATAGRYVIFHTDFDSHDCGIREIWLYGQEYLSAEFEYAAQDPPGEQLWTNSDTVDILWFTTDPEEGVDGYLITEDPAAEPDWETGFGAGWSSTVPPTYQIKADPGTDGIFVTLAGWARNSAGQTTRTPDQTIYYSVAEPITDSLVITPLWASLARVTWTTTQPSFTRVEYRVYDSEDDWTSTILTTTPATSHTHYLTGLEVDTEYEIRLHNSQMVQVGLGYTHYPGAGWPELDKEQMVASASRTHSDSASHVVENVLDDDVDTQWYTGSGAPTVNWLMIDTGDRYEVRMAGFYTHYALHWMEIYVTDDPEDWGERVAYTDLIWTHNQIELITEPKVGRYVIYNVNYNSHHKGIAEIWLYGLPAITVTEFDIAGSTGDSRFTRDDYVTVNSFQAEPSVETAAIDAWAITQTDEEPVGDEWNESALPTAPFAHTFNPGTQEGPVTLYAWVRDDEGKVGHTVRSILYYVDDPVVENIAFTPDDPESPAFLTVSWTTTSPAYGDLEYLFSVSAGMGDGILLLAENYGTQHEYTFQLLTMMPDDFYHITLINNGTETELVWPEPAPLWCTPGDANDDGIVTILDLIYVRERMNADSTLEENIRADLNEDGVINILDLIIVRDNLGNMCE